VLNSYENATPPGNLPQRNITVAFQGLDGSFSSLAAYKIFSTDITPLHTTHFREIFDSVTCKRATYGVLPIENAVAGSVLGNYDLLERYNCSIISEIYLPVQLNLLIAKVSDLKEDRNLANLTRIYSHPKALEQCSNFIELYPKLELVACSDTAEAAKIVANNGEKSKGKEEGANQFEAAIASQEAAKVFGLEILRQGIQNHPNNSTRFIAIAAAPQPEATPTKLSLIISLQHTPGSLSAVLNEVAQLGLNITKIESRPILGQPYNYLFHIDISCCNQSESEKLEIVVDRIKDKSSALRVLGRYRRAEHYS
jgi:prephenate dehydratase